MEFVQSTLKNERNFIVMACGLFSTLDREKTTGSVFIYGFSEFCGNPGLSHFNQIVPISVKFK